mgnify:CR=1 FL=1
MSDIISGDKAADARRWELPTVGGESGRPSARELESLQKQAWDEAWRKGMAEGRREGEKEARRLVDTLNGMAAAMESLDRELTGEVEQRLAGLALAVARQVIRRELHTEPEHVIGAIREALAVLPVNTTGIRVLLHPDDARLVRERLATPSGIANWEIVEDPVVSRGGCRVHSDTASVDATLEARIRRIAAAVLGDERGEERRGSDFDADAPDPDDEDGAEPA